MGRKRSLGEAFRKGIIKEVTFEDMNGKEP